jgi:hypothetical protein
MKKTIVVLVLAAAVSAAFAEAPPPPTSATPNVAIKFGGGSIDANPADANSLWPSHVNYFPNQADYPATELRDGNNNPTGMYITISMVQSGGKSYSEVAGTYASSYLGGAVAPVGNLAHTNTHANGSVVVTITGLPTTDVQVATLAGWYGGNTQWTVVNSDGIPDPGDPSLPLTPNRHATVVTPAGANWFDVLPNDPDPTKPQPDAPAVPNPTLGLTHTFSFAFNVVNGNHTWESGSNSSIAAIQITPIGAPPAVPEPASMSLLVLGGVATLLKKRRNRR